MVQVGGLKNPFLGKSFPEMECWQKMGDNGLRIQRHAAFGSRITDNFMDASVIRTSVVDTSTNP